MSLDRPRAAALLPILLAGAGGAMLQAAEAAPRFGPYRLLGEIGRGAMGIVYLAEQGEDAGEYVALKVAHAPPATPALRAQLENERAALAAVRHEHVVALLDAGTTPDGRPWLAMELVDGEPIDLYCARRALPHADRVRLLADVARAVHHLHERGFVHRDLKPENVLVTERGGRPVPKVIDLGLAARRDPAGADRAHVRERDDFDRHERAVVGTPAYMAPELFTRPGSAPDPRSDVFALGVVLHELVTDASPFARTGAQRTPAAERSGGAARATPTRIGRNERSASRPGTSASALASSWSLSARSATPPSAHLRAGADLELRRLCRAGLDATALAALASDPAMRLPSALALATALDRAATSATRWRRFTRWVRRLGVAALAALGTRRARGPSP